MLLRPGSADEQAGGLPDELASSPHPLLALGREQGLGWGCCPAEEGGVLYHGTVERSRTVFLPLSNSGQLQLPLKHPEAYWGPLCASPVLEHDQPQFLGPSEPLVSQGSWAERTELALPNFCFVYSL